MKAGPGDNLNKVTDECTHMATIADFVGTWYVGGDKTKLRSIKLSSTGNSLHVQGYGTTFSFDGGNEIKNGSLRGILSSDLKRIAWTDATFWDR